MGWTSTHIASWDINRKKECEKLLSCEVVKSAVKGSTWYGACRLDDGRIVGCVILTSIRNADYYNFSYKVIDESMGPAESECPESILKLLTPTDNEYALEWRRRCYEFNYRKKALSKLPLGTKIMCSGKEFVKQTYRGRTKWINWSERIYIMETVIAKAGYSISEGGAL